ncbi:hypothetical protein Tco_1570681 [Tanacetum coccineum]
MAAEVPQTLEYKGGQLNAAPVLEVENFTNWKKRKPEGQWTADERKAANLDQRLKSLIMSVLPDDQMNYVINCLTTKSTWDDLILYKALINELVNDGIKLSKLEINTGFINGLPKKWLSFCQSLRNTNHVKDSELASLFGKLKYEENLIDSIYETEKNKSLVSATPLSTAFFSTSIVQDFQDSPDDEEDIRSSQEYLDDLEEEYQARALLAKSKRFFKKALKVPSYQSPFQPKPLSSSYHKPELRPTKYFKAKYNKVKAKLALLSSSASAFKALMVKNKCLIAKAYEWDEEEVSSDDNEKVEVKVLMTLAEDNDAISKEGARNGEWVKISMRKVHTLLEMEDNNDRKTYLDYLCIDLNYVEEQRNNLLLRFSKRIKNLRTELKELTTIIESWLNISNKVKQYVILRVDQLTEDPSNSGQKDPVFVKSLADDTKVSIRGVERPRLSEAECFILPNHYTGRILPADSQRNTTDPPVAVTDSLTTDYDSTDESSVCSTPLPPLKKLDGVEPVSGPNTIKSILRSKSTFKAETLKGVIINESSSASARGDKSSSALKVNSDLSGKLKSVKIKDDPPLVIVIKELNNLKLQISKISHLTLEITNHNRTRDHADYMSTMNMSKHLKNQNGSSSRSRTPIPSKHFFPPCIHCGFNDHLFDDCVNYHGSYDHDTHVHNKIISLRRGIKPRNPQHVMKSCKTCGSTVHTTTDHNDIEWFRRGETLQAKKTKALKSTKVESSNANRYKTPSKSGCSRHMTGVKSYLHKCVEQPGPKVVFGDDSTCTTEGYGSIKLIHPQSSQAPDVSIQSSADPLQFDSGLVVPYCLPTDDPLECLNKDLAFVCTTFASSYPPNKLETVSNLMHQVVMPERQTLSYVGNCLTGNDHIARQYTQSKNVQWLKQKMMLAQLQEARIQLSKEQLAILADTGERVNSGPCTFTVITNALFQSDGIDLYDSDCDEVPTAQANFMANLSSCNSEVLSEVPYSDTYLIDMHNQDVQEMSYSKQTYIIDFSDNKIHSDSNIIPYSQYLQESQHADEEIDTLKENLSNNVKEKESLSKTLTVFKTESKEKEFKYIDKKIVLEKQNKELENIIFKMYRSTQAMHMLTKPHSVFLHDSHRTKLWLSNPFHLKKAQWIKPTLYDGSVIVKEHVVISVIDDEKTLILKEESRSKMLDKQNDPISVKQKINISPIDYSKLNNLKEDFGKHFVTQQELSAEQAFWLKHSNYNPDTSVKSHTSVRIEAPSDLSKVSLINESLKKLKYHLASFDKVVKKRTTSDAISAAVVDQCFVDKNTFEIEKKELKLENERLLEHIICQDVVNIVMHADVKFDNVLPMPNTFLDDIIALDVMKMENDRLMELLVSQDLVHTAINSLAVINDYQSIERSYIKEYEKNLKLAAELSQMNELLKTCSRLEQRFEQARTSNPLDNALAYACMYTEQIQELLVYVSDTCPSSPLKSEKLVAVTPINKAKKVTFAKISATSENNTQTRVDLHKTQTTNKPLVPSTSVQSSTNASRSIPRSTTKNTRIMQPLSSNQKHQRVEAHTRNAKSECSKCKKCLFDANHDLCTDITKIPRKQSKMGKHEHGDGRARKKPRGSYQSQTMVSKYNMAGLKRHLRFSLANTQEGMPRWIEGSTKEMAIYTNYTLRRNTRSYKPRIATLAIRVSYQVIQRWIRSIQ